MTEQQAIEVARGALTLALTLAGPPLFAILGVGIVISAFQAMTQINESTLSFVPKIVALVGIFFVLGPWMLQTIVAYTVADLGGLANVVR